MNGRMMAACCNALHVAVQRQAFRRGRQPALRAVEYLEARCAFEALQQLAHRRLRYVHGLGGAIHRAVFHHGFKGFAIENRMNPTE